VRRQCSASCKCVRYDIHEDRRHDIPQNISEFRIIGRIGKIDIKDKVTAIDVAANYNRKDGDDWKTDTLWNRVTAFAKVGERVSSANKGDLVHITGGVRQNSYNKDNQKIYPVELIADSFLVLAKASEVAAELGSKRCTMIGAANAAPISVRFMRFLSEQESALTRLVRAQLIGHKLSAPGAGAAPGFQFAIRTLDSFWPYGSQSPAQIVPRLLRAASWMMRPAPEGVMLLH
jgi:single-strand DNA-binding protein